MGGRANQSDGASLDVRQQNILLGLVEAVDFVDEEDGAASAGALAGDGGGEDAAEIGDGGLDPVESLEVADGALGDHFGEGGLSGTGRAEEDEGGEAVGFDEATERFAGGEEVALADILFQRAGPEPRGQRGVRRDSAFARRGIGGEEVVHFRLKLPA